MFSIAINDLEIKQKIIDSLKLRITHTHKMMELNKDECKEIK